MLEEVEHISGPETAVEIFVVLSVKQETYMSAFRPHWILALSDRQFC